MSLIHLPSVSSVKSAQDFLAELLHEEAPPTTTTTLNLVVLLEPKLFHHSRVSVRVYTHIAPVGIYPETTFALIPYYIVMFLRIHSFCISRSQRIRVR